MYKFYKENQEVKKTDRSFETTKQEKDIWMSVYKNLLSYK